MSDDKSDLTRIEDLGEFIHEANEDVDEALSENSQSGEQTQLDDLDTIEEHQSDLSHDESAEGEIDISDNLLPNILFHFLLCIKLFDRCIDRNSESINPLVNSATAGAGASGV